MKKGIIIISGVVLLILSLLFDQQIASSIVNYRFDLLTNFMHGISFLGSAIIVIIITTLLFLYDKGARKYIPLLWLTLVIALSFSLILKYLIARPRPEFFPLEFKSTNSFPSGHAAAMFAPLLLIDSLFPKIKWLWLAIAILVLISRIYLGVHYLSDVIAGALIGYLIGIFVISITKANV